MATYLGRNVNLALLIIIIGVVVALVGTTVFFQRGLQNRTVEYETKAGSLNECHIALTNYQEKYSAAQAKVNQTSQDIRKYDQLYEQKTGELKETESKLSSTEKQLTLAKLINEKIQSDNDFLIKQTLQLNSTIAAREAKTNAKQDKR